MSSSRLFSSLRFKVGIGLLLPLAIIIGLFSYLQYTRHRRLELSLLEESATQIGLVAESSLRPAMMAVDFDQAHRILADIAEREGVKTIFILGPQSEVRLSASSEQVGMQMALSDPGCQECHQPGRPADDFSAILNTATGDRVLRNCNPLENEPACQACHNAEQRLTGVLITDLSMADVDQHLAADRRDYILLLGASLIAAVVLVNVAMHELVIGRLERFIEAIRAFSQGNFRQRVAVESRDEIGELADAINDMAQGLEEKAELEQELRERTEELEGLYETVREKEARRRELLAKTINAQEDERKRLAREIHDELAQALTALTMRLEALEDRIPPDQVSLREQLSRTRELTVQTLDETRQLIHDLRPTILDDLGLVPAIRWYAERHLEDLGVQVSMQASGMAQRLPPAVETALFRVIQEAINNVARHANAERAEISLSIQEGSVKAVVEDDGRGFDPEEVLGGRDQMRGVGLLGMQERVDLLGGELEINSQPERGTRIVVRVPVASRTMQNGRRN